jgi:hypothetical protein
MNGHAQSGGHWNAAFGLVTRSSGGLGPPQWWSRSGNGSAKGILFIGGTPQGVAQRSHGLCHEIETGKTMGATSVPLRLRQFTQFTIVPYSCLIKMAQL